MNARKIQRTAYIAAHRILGANLNAPDLACPGARRSYAVDTIAGIIREVLELQNAGIDESRDGCETTGESGLRVVDRRPSTGMLLEFPLRASS